MTDLNTPREAERAEVLDKARRAKDVAPTLATLPQPTKNQVLHAAADALLKRADEIIAANQRDLDEGRAQGLSLIHI